jgi:hypothetical protein
MTSARLRPAVPGDSCAECPYRGRQTVRSRQKARGRQTVRSRQKARSPDPGALPLTRTGRSPSIGPPERLLTTADETETQATMNPAWVSGVIAASGHTVFRLGQESPGQLPHPGVRKPLQTKAAAKNTFSVAYVLRPFMEEFFTAIGIHLPVGSCTRRIPAGSLPSA